MAISATSAVISASCSRRSEARPAAGAASAKTAAGPMTALASRLAPPRAAPEACLGVSDAGVFSDLDAQVQLALPASVTPERATARVDRAHHVLVLSIDGFPRKAYPLDATGAPGGTAALDVGAEHLVLRPGDAAELRPLLAAERLTIGPSPHDRDNDGIPDPLDVLIGAKKLVVNADRYTEEAEGYISMRYPGGDVPRTEGVCTDVIVRAVRNAGLDIQKELHEDIRRARAAYPMVKGAGDPSIDQRRVGTLLPYFQRHWETHTAKIDDPSDPLRPGDVLFFDTFPSRPGPDHMGIVSDTLDDGGLPLVINNWTNGTVTAEMDLLVFVPVLYRFRLPP